MKQKQTAMCDCGHSEASHNISNEGSGCTHKFCTCYEFVDVRTPPPPPPTQLQEASTLLTHSTAFSPLLSGALVDLKYLLDRSEVLKEYGGQGDGTLTIGMWSTLYNLHHVAQTFNTQLDVAKRLLRTEMTK